MLWPRAADARQVRVATYNVHMGVGTVGSVDYDGVKAELQRIDADIIAFQELTAADSNNWATLATTLGYTNHAFSRNGPFSGNQYIGYFSRFPILSYFNVTSPPGAKELTRFPFRVEISVPGAAKPLVLWAMHHKATADIDADPFRRAIEAIRIRQDMEAYRAAKPGNDEFVFLGDLNEDSRYGSSQPETFDSIPTTSMPGTYALGSDITFPVVYRVFPDDRYATAGGGLVRVPAVQEGTTNDATFSRARFDYILVSTALYFSAYGSPTAEVYNSACDLGGGLPKAGSPCLADVSSYASDHLPVFADIHMTDIPDGIPNDWRLAQFGHIEQRAADLSRAGDDADSDGLTTLEEYNADTQPTNSGSVLQVTGVSFENGLLRVDWRGGTQARQVLEIRDIAPATNAWAAILTNFPPTTVAGQVMLDAGGDRKMFRIKAQR
jgi:endonuclease/exonuclease/phosphatase family metal-dependent hydrolase